MINIHKIMRAISVNELAFDRQKWKVTLNVLSSEYYVAEYINRQSEGHFCS